MRDLREKIKDIPEGRPRAIFHAAYKHAMSEQESLIEICMKEGLLMDDESENILIGMAVVAYLVGIINSMEVLIQTLTQIGGCPKAIGLLERLDRDTRLAIKPFTTQGSDEDADNWVDPFSD